MSKNQTCKRCQTALGTVAMISNDDVFEPNTVFIYHAVLVDIKQGVGEIFCPFCFFIDSEFSLIETKEAENAK